MLFVTSRKSQSGFSLVELMVVVAIIGILASIAIPSVNKYMAKARQSEVKANLSSIYTAEKAFFVEYNGYYGGFKVIGFSPEGKLRYNVGFSAVGAVPSGFSNTLPAANPFNAIGYCTGGLATTGCLILDNPGAVASATTTATTFLAQGRAFLTSTTIPDIWTINQNKELINTSNGIQ